MTKKHALQVVVLVLLLSAGAGYILARKTLKLFYAGCNLGSNLQPQEYKTAALTTELPQNQETWYGSWYFYNFNGHFISIKL